MKASEKNLRNPYFLRVKW